MGKFKIDLNKTGKKIGSWFNWIGSIGHSPGDNAETKSFKTIMTIASYVTVVNLLYFYNIYSSMGRDKVAFSLLVYAAFFVLNLLLFRFHRNFKILRDVAFIGIYAYIITYHTLLGGYVGSTGYIDYGLLVLVGVHIFYTGGQKLTWFFVYIGTAIVLYFLEPVISRNKEPLPDSFRLMAYVNDFVLMAGLIFLSIRYFTGVIRMEKAKSDMLIHNILPEPVVEELKIKGKSDPILVQKATTLFMDFVSFTSTTKNMSPEEMVYTLDEHFSNFDEILLQHNVEKLKTIGDGYMAVGGLPISNNTHPVDVALAAMGILEYLKAWNRDRDVAWNLRIGIHTGAMVAGIIGKSKFAYDVWGSSVNLSARLETASVKGAINVSGEFMELTKEFFDFEPRGQIEIKNIDPVEMFFLRDIKPELRKGHFTPNTAFYKSYEAYAKVPFTEREKSIENARKTT